MDFDAFNSELAKRLQGLKKDLGATKVHQGYKGTGSKAHRRQIWVQFNDDRIIDLWLNGAIVGLGGVCLTNYGKVLTPGRTPAEVYAEIVEKLKPLTKV